MRVPNHIHKALQCGEWPCNVNLNILLKFCKLKVFVCVTELSKAVRTVHRYKRDRHTNTTENNALAELPVSNVESHCHRELEHSH